MTLIINLQNFQQKKWYIIHDQNDVDYGEGNENSTSVKFETKNITSNLCNYSDAYILVIANITGTNGDGNTDVAFKNCALFTRFVTHINDKHIDTAECLDIAMPMYNLIEYSIIIQMLLQVYGSLKQMNDV